MTTRVKRKVGAKGAHVAADSADKGDAQDGGRSPHGAKIATCPALRGAGGALPWTNMLFGDCAELSSYAKQLREDADAVTDDGDLSALEQMLVTQAGTLDAMFNALSRRAAVNVGEYVSAADIYLRLALKAQAQCRATVEALAEIRSPRQVAFVKQANIANGPQQVNNGTATPASVARAENPANPSNELLTDDHGTTLDAAATGATGRGNQALEAVGKLDGTAH
jgi:hypothetical protein